MAALLMLFLLFIFHSQMRILSSQTIPNQDFSYMKFVQDAIALPQEETFDYIVIGGGTAGCPLAATLSSNYSVLLLERGSHPQTFPSVLTLEGLPKTFVEEDDGKTPFQSFTSEDGVRNTRARILGGGSMINFGFYSRAHREFFEKSGVKWDMKMMEKSYQWVEQTLVSRPNPSPWQSTFREALLQAGVVPDNGFTLNHLTSGTKTAGTIFDSQGNRHGAVELLNKANPRNLKVAIQATVERIIFSNSSGLSATGVLYSDTNGKLHRAMIRKKGEVILSAGALGSPQLLLLSGVGSKSYLSSLKLPVFLHQPHVGQSMVDDPRYGADLVLPFELPTETLNVVGIVEDNLYIESSLTNAPYNNHPVNLTVATFAGKFGGVVSTGSLRLASATDVRKNPTVRFNYYKHPYDLDRCVRGVRKVGELLNTKVMEKIKTQDLEGKKGFRFLEVPLPENMSDDGLVGGFCRKTAATFWHYHGGCLVGKVVDGDYRVIGIENLRVVDGSTFSLTPGTNPMPTVMMLGRYVGLKMLQQRALNNLRVFGSQGYLKDS